MLDRGITISNLIAFYYGRDAKKVKQDVVLQHCRMYGYRRIEDLAVTRFYTTYNIYKQMKKINEIDDELRRYIENMDAKDERILIAADKEKKIIPCDPIKYSCSNIKKINFKGRVLPLKFQPKDGISNVIMKIDQFIDEIDVSQTINRSKKSRLTGEFKIYKNEAIKLLEWIESTLIPDEEGEGDIKNLIYFLLRSKEESIYLVTRDNRKISKETDTTYAHSPDNGQRDIEVARKIAGNSSVLILTRQEGGTDKGWKNDEIFYWPILLTNDSLKAYIYAE